MAGIQVWVIKGSAGDPRPTLSARFSLPVLRQLEVVLVLVVALAIAPLDAAALSMALRGADRAPEATIDSTRNHLRNAPSRLWRLTPKLWKNFIFPQIMLPEDEFYILRPPRQI